MKQQVDFIKKTKFPRQKHNIKYNRVLNISLFDFIFILFIYLYNIYVFDYT